MALGIGNLWALARRVEDLLKLQTDIRGTLEIVDQRLKALEDRMLRLEAAQTQIITEARSAATAASTVVAGAVMSDTVTRLTRLELRTEQIEQRQPRLPGQRTE